MSANVTFSKDMSFFSSSVETLTSMQQVLPVPTFGPLKIPTFVNSSPNENQTDIAPPPLLAY